MAKVGTVAVEDDRGVRRETRSAEQFRELAAVHRAIIRMVEVGVRVPEDGSRDVALLVCRPADIHLEHANIRNATFVLPAMALGCQKIRLDKRIHFW